MSFNGTEASSISHSTAAALTKAYREANPHAVLGYFFGRDILLEILAQEGCEGIRFYYGLDGTTPQLVAVGADAEETDQVEGFIIADEAACSPPRKGADSILNSNNVLVSAETANQD
ncbi:MAG: hypothetical protein JWR44_1597 [Hymenobacter sp.]|jgi:hypothetical protein|nr:hypothetical protein [Hymenobacter sp.]